MAKRKLIETAIPLDAINAACKADKDRKTGTIRNLHKWFAPMPLPAWRALLFATLVDDPTEEAERSRLMHLIERLVASGGDPPDPLAVAEARTEVERCWPQGVPLVLDPFCGGGSTLIEAQRLGCETVGSDLNPVPVLISSVLTELIPSVAGLGPFSNANASLPGVGADYAGFCSDVLHYAGIIGERVRSRTADIYPPEPPGETTIAWLWCKTVPCPNPACDRQAPLIDSTILSKAPGNPAAVEIDASGERIAFRVLATTDVDPQSTVTRAGVVCVSCGAPIEFAQVRASAADGKLGTRLMARVAQTASGRAYRDPRPEDEDAARLLPPADLPGAPIDDGALGVRVRNYGTMTYDDLFAPRQALVLDAFASEVDALNAELEAELPAQYAHAVEGMLVLAVGKLAQMLSTQTAWRTRRGPSKAEGAFGMQTIPMRWDFAEVNPFGGSVGDWQQIITTALRAVPFACPGGVGRVHQSDARDASDLVGDREIVVATDPPYFGQIGYSDLADFFYLWLRRAGRSFAPAVLSTLRSPRQAELIAAPHRHEGDEAAANAYFVDGFLEVFRRLGERQASDAPMLVVYAAKEVGAGGSGIGAWAAMLEALTGAGLAVAGTWPIAAPGVSRLRSHGSNAVSGYVVLVCRPRPADAPRISRPDFVRLLRTELTGAIAELQRANIAPVDLAQAVIGPGMAVFGRHAKVVESDGSRVGVSEALVLINRTLAEVLDEQEGDLDPDSRWAATWYDAHGFASSTFGEADQLARAKGLAVDALVHAGIVTSGGNKVALIARESLPPDWDPGTDSRATAWEAVQYLVRALDSGGESAAAVLYARLGGLADPARELAYRLFQLAEKNDRLEEAIAYNSVVSSWPEIARLAESIPSPISQPSNEVLF